MKTTFITFTSQKGGVTKTTSSVSLAARLALSGAGTLIVDFDPQGQVSTLLGADKGPGVFNLLLSELHPSACIVPGVRPALDLLPSDQKTKSVARELLNQILSGEVSKAKLLTILRNAGHGYQYVVVDTPAAGILQELALEVADVIVVPTALDYLGLEGVASTTATISRLNAKAPFLVLPTMYRDDNESNANLANLHQNFGELVSAAVPYSAAVRGAAAAGQTIWEYEDRNSRTLVKVRTSYESLVAKMAEKVGE